MKLLVALNFIFVSSDHDRVPQYDYDTDEILYYRDYDTGKIVGPNDEGFKSNYSNLI